MNHRNPRDPDDPVPNAFLLLTIALMVAIISVPVTLISSLHRWKSDLD